MPKESDPEKKVKIRPRGLEEKEQEPTREKEDKPEEVPDPKKHKWDNRLRQSGVKFPAKMVSKALGSRSDEPPGEQATDRDKAGPELKTKESSPNPESTSPQPEGWESSPNRAEPPAPKSEQTPPKPDIQFGSVVRQIRRFLRQLAWKRLYVIHAAAAGLLAVVFFSFIFWKLGTRTGIRMSLEQATKQNAEVSKEALAELDLAMVELRKGEAAKALKVLRKLEDSKVDIASLSFLVALAAMQNGDIELAETKAAESVAKRERISDALSIRAVLETQRGADPSIKKFGDTQMRSELLLRQAILADAANPFPLVELASLYRYQKRNPEALALLQAARSRLNPVDSHSVIDVTIELSKLEDTVDAQLPIIENPDKDLATAFAAAYIAMRKGEFDKAADILKREKARTSLDLFDYLINDPALRRYAGEPQLRQLFQ